MLWCPQKPLSSEKLGTQYRDFPKLGVPSWGLHNKDYNILGSILGAPYFGKLPYTVLFHQSQGAKSCRRRGNNLVHLSVGGWESSAVLGQNLHKRDDSVEAPQMLVTSSWPSSSKHSCHVKILFPHYCSFGFAVSLSSATLKRPIICPTVTTMREHIK